MKISSNVMLYMVEDYNGELEYYPEYKEYRSEVPSGMKIVEIVHAYEDASEDYGVLDLYVMQQGDEFLGVKLHRAVGKHANYNELYEYDEFELQLLRKELVERWVF